MAPITEGRLAYVFGLAGGALILLGSLATLIFGMMELVVGHPMGWLASTGTAFVLLVVGGLAMFLAYLAQHDWSARPMTSGIVLAALAVVSWAFLGLGANVVTVVGALLVFLAGLLLAIAPVRAFAPSTPAAS